MCAALTLLKELDKKIDTLLENATIKEINDCIKGAKNNLAECNIKCKRIIESITNERQTNR